MKKTSKLSRFFKFFWLTSAPATKEWDELLNLLIDKGKVTELSEFTITFDHQYEVWISNHPFSSGHLFKYTGNSKMINCAGPYHCSRETKIKLEDFYHSLPYNKFPFREEIDHYLSIG